jgi:hypothetical protein
VEFPFTERVPRAVLEQLLLALRRKVKDGSRGKKVRNDSDRSEVKEVEARK